jgi:hypothetical protein
MTTYCFDLDGTLCSDTGGKYEEAEPFPEMISQVNQLKQEGHNIIIFTARGSGTGIDWKSITEDQLSRWEVAHDRLILGKPAADVYIDDKAVNVSEFRLSTMGLLRPNSAPAIFASANSSSNQ